MILRPSFFVLFSIIPCNPLMPDQSVLPMFDNSRNKPNYLTSTSLYGGNVDVVEEWDSVAPPPYKVVSTVIRASNTVHDVEEKVISAIKESDTMYSGGNMKDKLYIHETDKQPKESDSISSSMPDETNEINSNSEGMTWNDKTAGKSIITRNSSACCFLSINSTVTVTLGFTNHISSNISSTMNNTFEKIQNKLGHGEFASDLRIIDLVEIFNTLAILVAPTLSSDVTNPTHYPLLLENSTFGSTNSEFFNEVDARSVRNFNEKMLDRTFSRKYRTEDEAEISHMREREGRTDDKHSVRNVGDYAVVKNGRDHEDFGRNSKLDPQMIPRSEFAKNGINEEENGMNGCGVNHIDTSKEEDLEQRRSLNCKTVNERKLWEPRDGTNEKYNEEGEKDGKSPVLIHFERTLWEKLLAGLKCSQRDCKEALRPTESVRRYLIEPSISRARKHSSVQS